MMRTLPLLVTAMLAAVMPVAAQTPSASSLADSARVQIDAAVDRGDLQGIESAIAFVDRGLTLHPGHQLLRHYRGYASYRAGSLAFGQFGPARARQYFEQAVGVLEPLTRGATIPETHAVLASVYGMQIATSRVSMVAGMRLGPKASESMARAVEAGPRNPRVWVLRGISAFNTPSTFGGGVDKAASYLERALVLFAADTPRASLPTWGRVDAHVWLGQTYAKQGKREAARSQYQAALALQPHQPWVTQVLLPALDRAR